MTPGNAGNPQAVAVSVVQGVSGSAASSEHRSAEAWHGFYAALMHLKSCSHTSSVTSSTATTEAALSEVESSHGGLSPRQSAANKCDGMDSEQEEQTPETTLVGVSSSKSTRRRANRRRRTRRSRRGATCDASTAEGEKCTTVLGEVGLGSGATSSASHRDVVLLSDLFLGLDSPAVATAEFQTPSCIPRATFDESASTGRYNTIGTIAAGCDASARVPAPSAMCVASGVAAWSSSASPCYAQTSPHANTCSSPCTGMATSGWGALPEKTIGVGTQLPVSTACPVQPCLKGPPHVEDNAGGSYAAGLSSPCRAWAGSSGSVVSTSPTSERGPSSPAVTMAGAGSRSADALRSWLQASGLPSAADLVAQLQAAAPEFYED